MKQALLDIPALPTLSTIQTGFTRPAPRPLAAHRPRRHNIRVMLDRDGSIGFASSAIEELLGYAYYSIVGMHVSSLLPDLPPALRQALLAGGKKGKLDKVDRFTTHARCADGSRTAVSVTVKKSGFGTTVPLLLLDAVD